MKITLPVHHFLPRYSAGAEVYTLRLARHLRARGHDVEVVCIEAIDHGRPDRLDVARDEYDGIPVWRLSFDIFEAPERRLWDYDNSLLGAWFREYLSEAKPDLVHFQAGYLLGVAPLQAAFDAGVPSVLTLHDYWFLCPQITLQRGDHSLCTAVPEDPAACALCMTLAQGRISALNHASHGLFGRVVQRFGLDEKTAWVSRRRERLHAALALPRYLIAPVEFLAKRYAPFAPADRLLVSRLGIDLSQFKAVAPARDDGALRIGFIGQIAPHKGVHVLVSAFRQLQPGVRPIELHLFGNLQADPDYVKHLRGLAGDDPRVHFRGRFENGKVSEVLSSLDVTVVPSLWYENSPLSILESQAAGVPVVASDQGGMAELVEDGVTGLHFKLGDAVDLRAKLQRLINEAELLPRLKQETAARPPRSVEDEVSGLEAMYLRLTQGELA